MLSLLVVMPSSSSAAKKEFDQFSDGSAADLEKLLADGDDVAPKLEPPPATAEKRTLLKLAAPFGITKDWLDPILASLGGDISSPLEDLAFITSAELEEALSATTFNDKPWTPLQKGKLRRFFTSLSSAGAPSLPQPATVPPVAVAAPPPSGTKRKLADVLDVMDDTVYEVLSPEKID